MADADYEIFKLNPKDYDKCGTIWNMSRHPEMTQKWYEEIISGNRVVYVYTENGAFIGEGALVFDNGDRDYTIPVQRVYLSRMIVKPDFQNRGIGGIILDYLVEAAKQLGYKEIALGVNKDNIRARHLYTKKGFDTVIFDGEDEYGEYVKLLKTLL
jgi:ribosomal protein S18 acetylase RimI-like enzyme